MPRQLNLSQTAQNVRWINTHFYAAVTCELKLVLVHFTQTQIYLRYMMKEINTFFMRSMKNRRVIAKFIAWFCTLEACQVICLLSCVSNTRLRWGTSRLLVSALVLVLVVALMLVFLTHNSDSCWLDTDRLPIQWLEIFQLQCILPSASLWHASVPSHWNPGLWCIALLGLGLLKPFTFTEMRMSEHVHKPQHDSFGHTFTIPSPSISVWLM
jgi:cell division protein FtsW (lipid II flippase)